MAKNPAMLLYTADFLVGVSFMTMEERGQYITLLCLQHQKGHMSMTEMEMVVGKVASNVLMHFKCDSNGLYYNERTEEELIKRNAYSESRRANRNRPNKSHMNLICESYESHMSSVCDDYENSMSSVCDPYETHMENENNNDNDNTLLDKKERCGEKKKGFSPPTLEEVEEYCRQRKNNVDAKRFYDYFSEGEWKDSKGQPVKNWKQKVITWEKFADKGKGSQPATHYDADDDLPF